jgi:hypothetical protein
MVGRLAEGGGGSPDKLHLHEAVSRSRRGVLATHLRAGLAATDLGAIADRMKAGLHPKRLSASAISNYLMRLSSWVRERQVPRSGAVGTPP